MIKWLRKWLHILLDLYSFRVVYPNGEFTMRMAYYQAHNLIVTHNYFDARIIFDPDDSCCREMDGY